MNNKKNETMKTKLTILLLALSLSAASQNIEDKHNILLLCFEHAEMTVEDHLNDDGVAVLVVVDNGVLSNDLSVVWFDNPVEFKTMQAITDGNIQAYIVFDSLTLNDNQATVGVSYVRQGGNNAQHFILQFTKVGNNWIISSN